MSGKTPGADRRPSGHARRKAVVESYTPEERAAARYVRRAYVLNRSAYESAKHGRELIWRVPQAYDGVTRPTNDPQDVGKVGVNVWFEVARWCLRWQVEPQSFIQFVFARLDINHRVPEPRQVCSEDLIPAYREYVTKGAVAAISSALEAQVREARAAVARLRRQYTAIDPAGADGKRWTIVQNVVLDRTLPLSPLFRYLLAKSSARDAEVAGDAAARDCFRALARRLFDRAAIQFWVHKDAYAEHWKRWLPKSFPQAAEARFRELAFNEGVGDDDEA